MFWAESRDSKHRSVKPTSTAAGLLLAETNPATRQNNVLGLGTRISTRVAIASFTKATKAVGDMAEDSSASNLASDGELPDLMQAIENSTSMLMLELRRTQHSPQDNLRWEIRQRQIRVIRKQFYIANTDMFHFCTSQIWKDGKQVYLGGFAQAEQAAVAHDIAAIVCRGDAARTNFDLTRFKGQLQQKMNKMSVKDITMTLRNHGRQNGKILPTKRKRQPKAQSPNPAAGEDMSGGQVSFPGQASTHEKQRIDEVESACKQLSRSSSRLRLTIAGEDLEEGDYTRTSGRNLSRNTQVLQEGWGNKKSRLSHTTKIQALEEEECTRKEALDIFNERQLVCIQQIRNSDETRVLSRDANEKPLASESYFTRSEDADRAGESESWTCINLQYDEGKGTIQKVNQGPQGSSRDAGGKAVSDLRNDQFSFKVKQSSCENDQTLGYCPAQGARSNQITLPPLSCLDRPAESTGAAAGTKEYFSYCSHQAREDSILHPAGPLSSAPPVSEAGNTLLGALDKSPATSTTHSEYARSSLRPSLTSASLCHPRSQCEGVSVIHPPHPGDRCKHASMPAPYGITDIRSRHPENKLKRECIQGPEASSLGMPRPSISAQLPSTGAMKTRLQCSWAVQHYPLQSPASSFMEALACVPPDLSFKTNSFLRADPSYYASARMKGAKNCFGGAGQDGVEGEGEELLIERNFAVDVWASEC
eukprot:gene7306-423_t